jgi:hypothetical protein
MLIIAVDPGGRTGMAQWYDGDFTSWEVEEPMEVVRLVGDAIREWDAVVCENFRPRPRVTWQPDALHIIGGLRYFTWRHEVPFILQEPAQAKTFATDERLKAAGFYTKGGEGHANDAARHLLRYLVRSKLIRLEDVL